MTTRSKERLFLLYVLTTIGILLGCLHALTL